MPVPVHGPGSGIGVVSLCLHRSSIVMWPSERYRYPLSERADMCYTKALKKVLLCLTRC